MTDWQPIESAPMDGTHILIFRTATMDPADTMFVCFYNTRWQGWQTTPGHYGCNPTHWMPLPPVPGSPQERADG